MLSSVAIVGYAPEHDAALLREMAGKFGVRVAEFSRIEDLAAEGKSIASIGYISFLPENGLAAQELIGIAKQDRNTFVPLPLFQRVDGPEVPASVSDMPIAGLFSSPLTVPAAWTILHTLVQNGQSVAAQAAVSIERAQLNEDIRELFEGFLRSSIAAIDERDRTTSGHSKRVMGYAMAFAETAGAEPGGPFAEVASTPERKRQLQFAALLHDIGKIGVPERILNKEGRLQPQEFSLLMARLDYVAFALHYAPPGVSWKSTKEVADDRRFLERINTAARLRDDDLQRLALLREKYYHTADGRKVQFLSEHEWKSLSVRAGNLTDEEREVIHSHALSTYRILSKIPWTQQFEMIPVIAATHHERIDGSGYPHGLRGEEMSIESKILAVIDVYEALVAQDRPYKPKMSPEKAIEILNREVTAGHLDAAVVKFFIEKGIYRLYTDRKKT
jgi:HD-GYP domain-containing protein (c-di-GMP phosphodiesterase class II)